MGRNCLSAESIRTFRKIKKNSEEISHETPCFRVACNGRLIGPYRWRPKRPLAKVATSSSKTNWTVPKTSWGDPDLQGQWPATANIPMQRPVNLGERAELTDAELAQRESQAKKQAAEDGEETAKGSEVTINPPSYWVERGKPVRQASLVGILPTAGFLP